MSKHRTGFAKLSYHDRVSSDPRGRNRGGEVRIRYVNPDPREPDAIAKKLEEAVRAGFNGYELAMLRYELETARQHDAPE